MTVKLRDARSALIAALGITFVSVGLFYLMFYRAAQIGALTRPVQFLSLPSYPGMLIGFVAAGAVAGNFHTGANRLGLVLAVAIPLDVLLYFAVIFLTLRVFAGWRRPPKLS